VDGGALVFRTQIAEPGFGGFPVPEFGRLARIELGVGVAGNPDHAIAIGVVPFGNGGNLKVANVAVGRVASVEDEGHTGRIAQSVPILYGRWELWTFWSF
jgi:hypothetical protein